jgi:hypothetical protein
MYDELTQRASLAARMKRGRKRVTDSRAPKGPGMGGVHVISVHLEPIMPGVYEAAVIVGEPDRVRAVAVRLERQTRRWLATDVCVL